MLQQLKKRLGFGVSSRTVDPGKIPEHVAIIMDGNGRWARNHGLPRVVGHQTGMGNVKNIAKTANKIGVKVLTLYAFSTENWKRPRDEIEFLLKLPGQFFPETIGDLVENNIQVRMMGYRDDLPDYTLKPMEDAISRTKQNTGLILNIALNYGSRKEMIDAIQRMAEDVVSGKIKSGEMDESLFSQYLFSRDLPDPDLLIRTSGELRISNFMLWQLAYTELWFSNVHWPEFKDEHFLEAIREYQYRNRRYGGL